MDQRAVASETTTEGGPITQGAQYLTCLLGSEVFALDIRSVRGVINLRGAVVPVIDLQARFGRPARPSVSASFKSGSGTYVGVLTRKVSPALNRPPSSPRFDNQ